MKKLLLSNLEKVLQGLGIIAIVYSFIDALMVAKNEMMIAEEGIVGILTFFLSFVLTLGLDLTLSVCGIIVLYLLADIRTLLAQANQKRS